MLFVFGCGFFCDQPSNSFLFAIFSLYYYKRHWYEIYWSNSSMVCQPKNPVGVNATLKLTLERGLVLQDTDGTIAWLTNISSKSVPSLNLTNMGNLMLLDENNATMWQSFDHRTKTLVVVQKLMAGQNLTMKRRIVFALSHPWRVVCLYQL